MKLLRKLVAAIVVAIVVIAIAPLEVFAYDPFNDFPNQTLREWPTKDYNNVATTLPDPPAIANTVNMADMFNYPKLIYTDTGSVSQFPDQTAKLATNRSYVTEKDSSVAVITRDARWQSGVMWSLEENKIKLNEPFHMVAYVYLGNRTQNNKNFHGLGGADGITFTMHNDLKQPSDMLAGTKLASGSLGNTGINAYGALGNGLGVYGSNFSANVSSDKNNMVDFWRGVENGITLEFDTFYNDNNTSQHTDNDLTSIIYNENHVNTQYGHIAINLLNDFKNNRGNRNVEPDKTTNKHKIKLSLGWDGEVSEMTNPYRWNISKWPTSSLADGLWHRLEVTWTPNIDTNTGNLNYTIYKQGHEGARNIAYSDDRSKDGTGVISYDVPIGTGDYSLEKVFGVSNLNNTVYWGFSGSTGGQLNNQAVQMVQLPISYYNAELKKVDQEGKVVSGAVFELEKLDAAGEWQTQGFYNPRTGDTVTQLSTTPHQSYQGVVGDNGSLKLSQLTEGTYRWKEVAAAEGYQLGQVYWPNENGFLVNYSESLKENAFTYTATNKKLYQLELTKTDSDTQQPLNDVPFIISKTENDKQYYLKVNADSTGFEWTETETEAKQFLSGKTYAAGENGQISEQTGADGKLIVKYFPDAPNLTWKEVSVPTGYSSKGTLTGVFVPTADNKYAYTASQKNTRLYQVTLEKIASDTNEGLKDAVFALQRKDGNQWVEVTYDGKSEFTTNSEGKISIPNLEAGTYRWEEKKAPTGYKSDQQYYPKEEGFEVAYHDGLTIDSSNQNYLFEATTAKNSPRDFELVLEKLSSTFNRPIGEVEFKLYSNLNGTTFSDEMTTLKTNSEGKIVFGSDLIKANKTYYLVETKAADGFIALKGYFKVVTSKTDGIKVSYVKSDGETDASPFEFSTADGNIYKGNLKVYNKRKSILPITGGNGILQYITIGAGMILFATLFFLLKRKALKWFLVLAIATTGFAGLGSHANKVFADEQDKVTLEINRLIYQPSDTQFKSGTPVEGAELEVFDVTDTFYDFVTNDKLSRQAAQEKLSKSTDLKGKSLAKAETDNLGKASFTVAKTSNQQVAVYLIKETVTPVAVTPMEPLVVVLPIVDEQGNEKEFVSLYPKSHGTFTFDKSIDDKQDSYNLGEAIPYRLSTVIPQDIVSLVTYEIEDVYDQGLNFIPESLAILVDGKKQSELIKTVTPSENQFRVSFDVAQLARFAGKKIEVTYNMVIKDSASIDQPLVNTATLYPGNLTPLVDKEEVITGGFRFIKLGASGGNTPLANAKFVIKKPEDNAVLTHKDGHYQFEKVETDAAGVVQLTSDAKGNFEIKGLRYGEYLVCEIQAPSGYVLNDKPTTFTIRANSYKDGPALTIYNTEKPKVNLPKTGVVETSIALVGLFILASSLMMIRRKKEN